MTSYRRFTTFAILTALAVVAPPALAAGVFPSYHDNGVSPDVVAGWVQTVADYLPTSEVVEFDSFGGGPHNQPTRGLGVANGTTVSLGDLNSDALTAGDLPGSITLRFSGFAFDGPGADLAVFENAFSFSTQFSPDLPSEDYTYAELAFVEVSTNGVDFARFPATSLNQEPPAIVSDTTVDQLFAEYGRDFAGANTTNIHNLAGVHPAGTGTPFDLSELAADPLVVSGEVNLGEIRFVRLIDIPGDGSVLDSAGNPILDTWHTTEAGGLDLDAVGAIHFVPEPASFWLLAASCSILLAKRAPRRKL